jgi:hypothetical protein
MTSVKSESQFGNREKRRKEPRRHALKAGQIQIDKHSTIDCIVRNLTEGGACLEVASPIGIPNTFVLSIPLDKSTRRCHVSWKNVRKIGVSFS